MAVFGPSTPPAAQPPSRSLRRLTSQRGKSSAGRATPNCSGDDTFRVEETAYQDGKEIFQSLVRRHARTGLLLDEAVKHGSLDRDYHHYELTIDDWSGCQPRTR